MKRAIIIGATSGIGREVAITLARQGVVVVSIFFECLPKQK